MIVVLLLAAAQLPAADSLARTNISSTEIAWEPMTKYASVNLVYEVRMAHSIRASSERVRFVSALLVMMGFHCQTERTCTS